MPVQTQIQHFDHGEGQYYYSCGCAGCKHKMLWPRSMFNANCRNKWNVSITTHECKRYTEVRNLNKHFRYSVYRWQYRNMLQRDGLPRTKLTNRITKNLKDPIYLEFKKKFEHLKRDERGHYLCPVYNIPMYYKWRDNKGHLKISDHSPSIDRIDNDKPHTLDNIQIISWAANNHRGSATPEQMVLQGEHYKNLLKRGKPLNSTSA